MNFLFLESYSIPSRFTFCNYLPLPIGKFSHLHVFNRSHRQLLPYLLSLVSYLQVNPLIPSLIPSHLLPLNGFFKNDARSRLWIRSILGIDSITMGISSFLFLAFIYYAYYEYMACKGGVHSYISDCQIGKWYHHLTISLSDSSTALSTIFVFLVLDLLRNLGRLKVKFSLTNSLSGSG